jgi:hypothetical protein
MRPVQQRYVKNCERPRNEHEKRMNDQSLSGRRVFIFQQRGWARNIGHGLAKILQYDGATLAAFTMKKSTDIFIRSQSEVKYDFIISDDAILEDPEEFLNGTEHSLDTICEELNIDSVWIPAYSQRRQMRDYDEAYYYSHRQKVPDDRIIIHVKAIYEMCRRVLDDFKPHAIIVPIFGGLPHIFMNIMARQRGIPMFGITDTKISGIFCFTHSYVDDAGPFVERIDQLNSGAYRSENLDEAAKYIGENRKTLSTTRSMARYGKMSRRSPYREFRRLLGDIRREHNSPNFVKGLGSSIDARKKRVIIRDFFRRKQFERATDSMKYASFDDVGKFAYFPLQTEPEASIDVYGPRFNNQIETARQIAMSLPGEMTLVVKDHPAMRGYRSPSYLEKLARTPNITLVDSKLSSNAVLARANVVISITGTVLMEAALLRVPTIQLGDLNPTLRLPNVTHHTDLSTLSKIILEVSKLDLTTPEYEQGLMNYVAAAYDSGFTTDIHRAWEEGKPEELPEIYSLFRNELLRCLISSAQPVGAVD